VLRATEERLKAELARQSELLPPEDFKTRMDDPNLAGIWKGQIYQFESRLAAIAGQRNVIREQIAQLEAQIVGSEGQVKSYRAQLDSVRGEMDSIKPLLERGLIAGRATCNWSGPPPAWRVRRRMRQPVSPSSARRSPSRCSRRRSWTTTA
jgi:hypothetical protein